jgi:hypothetical protein
MPIFAGGGGNHALVGSIELLEALKAGITSDSLLACVREAVPRWQRAIGESETDMHATHQPMEPWNALVTKKGVQ